MKQHHREEHPHLEDIHQRWWQLTSIQVAGGIGALVSIILGKSLLELYGVQSAILAIVVGNLILWLAGLAIVTMSDHNRKNTLENARTHFGFLGGVLVAITLVIATVSWFSIQTSAATAAILQSFGQDPEANPGVMIKVGLGLGLFATAFSVYGIRSIKWLNVISMPIVICFYIFAIFVAPSLSESDFGKPLTLAGIPLVIGVWLAGVADYPTFFRHSRSRSDSVIALTAILILSMLSEIAGIFIGGDIRAGHESLLGQNAFAYMSWGMMFYLAFLGISNLCVNSANIYSGSIGWEALVPRRLTKILVGKKEYVILGLTSTLVFAFFQAEKYLKYGTEFSELIIGTMGIVLIASFATKRITRRKITRRDHIANCFVWFVGIIIGFLCETGVLMKGFPSLMVAVLSTVLVYIVVIVAWEIGWSLHHRL